MISGSAAQVETNVINVLVMEEKLSAPSTMSVFGDNNNCSLPE